MMKTLITLTMALMGLVGCATNAQYAQYAGSTNPDGTPYSEDQLLEIERFKGRADKIMRRTVNNQRNEASLIYQKQYVAAFDQALMDTETAEKMKAVYNGPPLLDSVNVALHIFDASSVIAPLWLSFIPSGDFRAFMINHSYERLINPSISFFHVPEDSPEGDKAMLGEFMEMTNVMQNQLDCSPTQRHFGHSEAGDALEGEHYYRSYVCPGAKIEPGKETSALITTSAKRGSAFSDKVKEGAVYSEMSYYAEFEPADRRAAIKLFDAIGEKIPDEWYTIFTGEDNNGEWRIFVAQGDRVIAFPVPIKK